MYICNMDTIQQYLEGLSTETLMTISHESEGITFAEDSRIRNLITEYCSGVDFMTGLITLRNAILTEVTRRYFNVWN